MALQTQTQIPTSETARELSPNKLGIERVSPFPNINEVSESDLLADLVARSGRQKLDWRHMRDDYGVHLGNEPESSSEEQKQLLN